jgi:hypothetical protein
MENPMTDYEAYRVPAWTDRQSPSPQALSFRKGTRLLWRHKAIILVSMAVGLSIAFLVRSQTIPRYEAEAQIVLDVRNTTIMKFDSVVSGLLPQPEVIHTEMDIIASRGMAERVLDHLPPGDVKQLGDDGAMTTPMSRFFTETWPGILEPVRGVDAVAEASGCNPFIGADGITVERTYFAASSGSRLSGLPHHAGPQGQQ